MSRSELWIWSVVALLVNNNRCYNQLRVICKTYHYFLKEQDNEKSKKKNTFG